MHLPTPKKFVAVPAGIHEAICFGYVFLGTQTGKYDDGKVAVKPQIAMRFEFPDIKMPDGRPATDSPIYTWSMNKSKKGMTAKLREHLEQWRGVAFTEDDLANGWSLDRLIGIRATIVYSKNPKDNDKTIISAFAPSKIKPVKAVPANPTVKLGLTPEFFDQAVFDGLTEFMRSKIMGSPEYKVLKGIDDNHPVHDESGPYDDGAPPNDGEERPF
jgi:hypothetical protein